MGEASQVSLPWTLAIYTEDRILFSRVAFSQSASSVLPMQRHMQRRWVCTYVHIWYYNLRNGLARLPRTRIHFWWRWRRVALIRSPWDYGRLKVPIARLLRAEKVGRNEIVGIRSAVHAYSDNPHSSSFSWHSYSVEQVSD